MYAAKSTARSQFSMALLTHLVYCSFALSYRFDPQQFYISTYNVSQVLKIEFCRILLQFRTDRFNTHLLWLTHCLRNNHSTTLMSMKQTSCKVKDYNFKVKTGVRLSYLYNGKSYTDKRTHFMMLSSSGSIFHVMQQSHYSVASTCVQRVVNFVTRRHTLDTVGTRFFHILRTQYTFIERSNMSWHVLTC